MSDVSGKAKENAGKLAGDDDLKREGQTEQAAEKAKDTVDNAADKVQEIFKRD